ncbi:hypothetical protein NA78x_004397 [Anatilimnocola sp. NA78]|uniref:hypothetical protein n=1 Tax=Anatilimnocola sp. NA78 TaxID=3415683 RepID=UPI003CE49055
MRAYFLSAVAVAATVVLSLGSASAQTCGTASGQGGNGCQTCGAAQGGNGCQSCGGRHGHHRKYTEGKDYGFNCGCNGSYNYPVPPLYTYHWPGMYKAVRMTDYHSPWRFPPIKPFIDELAPADVMTFEESQSDLLPISAMMPVDGPTKRVGEPESLSSKLQRSYR